MYSAGNMAAPYQYQHGRVQKNATVEPTNRAVVKVQSAPMSVAGVEYASTYVPSHLAHSVTISTVATRGAVTRSKSREALDYGQTTSHRGPNQEPMWFILLKDKEVRGGPTDSLLQRRNMPSAKKFLRGSLLQGCDARTFDPGMLASRGQTLLVQRVELGSKVEFECRPEEVARLSTKEKDLLLALSTEKQRLAIFQDKEMMSYALSLQVGSHVKVQHRNDSTSPHENVQAIVRYIGILQGSTEGTHFGVELIDSKHRGKGTSDGEFAKRRYFQTDHDCALFVSISKLVKGFLPQEELTSIGAIMIGTMVCFQDDDGSWKAGKAVYITVPPGQSNPYVVIEMPLSSCGSSQRWNGTFDGVHVFNPRDGVITCFIQASCVRPQYPGEVTEREKSLDVIKRDEIQPVPLKERPKGKKSSESVPFFLSGTKPKKGPLLAISHQKPRHDYSDDYYHVSPKDREDSLEDITYYSGHFNDESKPSFVDKVKGKLKSKFNGSKEDLSKAVWYPDPKKDLTRALSVADNLETDVVEEVTNVIHKDWRSVARALYLNREDVDYIIKTGNTEKERTVIMLNEWQKRGVGYDKITRLAEACRTSDFRNLADDLEQGLNEEILMKVAYNVSNEKYNPLGHFLNFSDGELDQLEREVQDIVPRIRLLLAKWRTKQSHNSDKILLLSGALHSCGLRQLQLEVARGLDDDIMSSFAIRIGNNWRILAQTLRMSQADIHHLGDFSENKQSYMMLMLWRRKQNRDVDVLSALSKGLEESGLTNLADDLVQGVNDNMIYTLATLIGDVWQAIAAGLGFSKEEVLSLEQEKKSETEIIITMLNKWRERHDYTQHRFDFLMTVLREVGLGGMADSFERDRQQKIRAEEEECRSKSQTSSARDVSREMLVNVSKKLGWRDLCRAMDVPTEDSIEIENLHNINDQRVFTMLDRWRRRGHQGKRRVDELLQVIANAKGTLGLIDEIMTTGAADKKEEDQQRTILDFAQLEDVPPDDTPPSPDLEINSMVEVTFKEKTHYGLIRWIGIPEGSRSPNLVAGIELEDPILQGATDGVFNRHRYFKCEPSKAIFVYLSKCRPDSRFPSQSQTFRSPKRQTSLDFGGFASPLIEGSVDPPSRLMPNFVGMQRGIQGDQNSCYLDTTLFSMFAYNSVFDPLLRRTQGKDDLQLYEEVQRTLREGIVNPLRKTGFVRADRVLQLREHLDNLGTTKGLMSEEKDPEEFLHTLLSEVFKSRPLLNIRHGKSREVDESNIYQIFLDKDESFTLPTVEQLLLQSFQEHDLKLVNEPTCMIVQMPRFGKDYKMYNRIVPSLQLDITNILEGYPRQCIVCGNLATMECNGCKSEEAVAETTHIKNYCIDCFQMMHSIKVPTRARHKPTDLCIPDFFLKDYYSKSMASGYTEEEVDHHRQALLTHKLMDLFAVICIRTSHYVAFVKAGREPDSEWVFFDSMADRQGDQQGYNVPQITHLKDFKSWVNKEHIRGRVESRQLTPLMDRLLGDAYICMYSNSRTKDQTYV